MSIKIIILNNNQNSAIMTFHKIFIKIKTLTLKEFLKKSVLFVIKNLKQYFTIIFYYFYKSHKITSNNFSITASIFFIDTNNLTAEIKKKIIKIADLSLTHTFDLLGSGNTKVSYFTDYKGLDGIKYSIQPIHKIDTNGTFLKKVINKSNLKISMKIWQSLSILKSLSGLNYEPIDWHRDFKSGYRWNSKKYFKSLKYGNLIGTDVKVPWELSRFQHLFTISLAYKITKKKKYLFEYFFQVMDWIALNPPMFGINYRCTMDVAIRAANLTLSYSLIKDEIDRLYKEPKMKKEIQFFKQLFTTMLINHGKFIINNLEWSNEITSNHYLSDISGLYILSLTLKDNYQEAEEWYKFSLQELQQEIDKQIYDDGSDFEASTCYHRLVTELFAYPVIFTMHYLKNKTANKNLKIETQINNIFGNNFINRLKKVFNANLYLLKPNGQLPQIGDNDSGFFFKIFHREIMDGRYLLLLGYLIYGDTAFYIKNFFKNKFDIAELLILNNNFLNSFPKNKNSLLALKPHLFKNSGWFVMRNNLDYCIISCGPNGQNSIGGHSHNDKLSFELSIDGEDIIIDPGSYLYTPFHSERNKFRSTRHHNTITFDNFEQNDYYQFDIFSISNDTYCKIIKTYENDEIIYFEGFYVKNLKKSGSFKKQKNIEYYNQESFQNDKNIIFHKRVFSYNKKLQLLKIKDIVNRYDMKKTWTFILPDEAIAKKIKITSDNLEFDITEIDISTRYGIKKISKCLKSQNTNNSEFNIIISFKK